MSSEGRAKRACRPLSVGSTWDETQELHEPTFRMWYTLALAERPSLRLRSSGTRAATAWGDSYA